jgi:ATP/maltotriose-dependent transcriptional regulator MalT
LCLDDLHLIEDDPLLAQLVERLHQSVTADELSLIIISRRVPEFVPTAEFEPLSGLSDDDTRALLASHSLSLPEELVADLYAQTEGNAQLLILAIEALKRTQNPRRVVAHLAETDDIERYLMNEVDTGLTLKEREVMSAVSTMLGYPATREAIEATLEGGSARRILGELSRRHLLVVAVREWNKEYLQHTTVRTFYYDLIGRRERREMHSRAAKYYFSEQPDKLKAALHYERADEYEQAARLVTEDVWTFINQGQARALSRLLERFRSRQLDAALWAAVNITRGQVLTLLRESQLAKECYQKALATLDTLSDASNVRESKARACRGLGTLLEYEAPQEALEWLNRGLRELAGASIQEEAALLIKIGSVQVAIGDLTAALSALERGLELLPDDASQLRARALNNLGTVYGTQGDIERGNTYTLQGLEISQELNDYYQMLVMQSNLGIDKEILGDWTGAVTDYRQALALAEQLGSVAHQVRIEGNLGLLYTNRGDDELARARLSHALELARRHSLNEQQIAILSNLAELLLRQGEPEAAEPLLVDAERLAREMDSKFQLPEIYRGRARVQLSNGQTGEALVDAERSVGLARELGLDMEEGMGLRVLGQVLIASGQIEPGVGALEQSLALLADDPYEVARSKMEWGNYLVFDTEKEFGKSLLDEARTTFEELAAKRDLAAVDKILETID